MKALYFSILSLCILGFSCKKEPGPGGKATLKGTVITRYFDPYFKTFQYDHPSTESSVYLIYGDEAFYGDNTETGYNGVFAFQYLQPGKYTVYVYSEDTSMTVPSNEVMIQKSITISKNDKTVTIDTLFRYKRLKYTQGYASICGKISKNGENVFITFPDNSSDNTRSDNSGNFCFNNLIKGIYTVFWVNNGITYSKTDTITSLYQTIITNL